jgi:hypothetical protein
MRRKPTTWEAALRDAAKELALPKGDFRCERLATLTIQLKVLRSQWADGKLPNSSDMLALMDAIGELRKEAAAEKRHDFTVQFVEGFVGVCDIECKFCGKVGKYEVSDKPFERATPSATPAPAVKTLPEPPDAITGQAAPEPSPAEPKPAAPDIVVEYREGLSASAFRSQVVNGVAPPLKRLQPDPYAVRSVSPLS